MRAWARIRRAWWGVRQELRWGWRHVRKGRWSYMINVLAYRALALSLPIPGTGTVHQLVTDNGVTLFYRRDRGDIQGIREIFIDEIYRLPIGASPTSLVDFGANIGLATVWLCRQYAVTSFAAFEPMPANFALLEQNCKANGLRGTLHRCAIGTISGTTTFDVSRGSNMGQVGEGTQEVEVVGVESFLEDLSFAPDLIKIDVEGMERELLTAIDPQWLSIFSMVVMEMHPQYFEIGPLIDVIIEQGFSYFPPVEKSRGIERSKRERLFVRAPTSLTR